MPHTRSPDDPVDVTLRTYAATTGRYLAANSPEPPPAVQEFLGRFVELLPGPDVLEVGSGPGRDADDLERLGVRVVRTDATPEFVERLQGLGHDARLLDVRDGDLGGPWDGVLAAAVLLHLDRQQCADVLRRVRAAVGPAGVLALTLKEGDGEAWTSAKLGRPRHFTYWREPALRDVLERSGWSVVSIDHVDGRDEPWLFVLARVQARTNGPCRNGTGVSGSSVSGSSVSGSSVSGFSVAVAREADSAAIDSVLRAAFHTQPAVADMVAAIRASPQWEPDLALVAPQASLIVGFVMISHAELVEDNGRHHDVLTLSPLGVLPASQRQGIGVALVRAVLAREEARTELPRLVTLEGDPRFYGRLGFEFAGDHGVTFDLPEWAPFAAAQVYRLSGHDPALRGRVTYPPAFALADG